MKTIWSVLVLCLVGDFRAAVHASPIRRTGTEDMAAPQDEVKVLMYGVIQFSESFNHIYETTEAKMAKISQTLNNHEGALRQLGEQTEEAAEVEKQIKGVIQLLQAQMAKQQAQTKTAKDWLANIEQEEVELKTKVKSMEVYLNNTFPTSVKELQERAAENASILKGLQYLTQFQKQNIETHDGQLSTLQKMSESM